MLQEDSSKSARIENSIVVTSEKRVTFESIEEVNIAIEQAKLTIENMDKQVAQERENLSRLTAIADYFLENK